MIDQLDQSPMTAEAMRYKSREVAAGMNDIAGTIQGLSARAERLCGGDVDALVKQACGFAEALRMLASLLERQAAADDFDAPAAVVGGEPVMPVHCWRVAATQGHAAHKAAEALMPSGGPVLELRDLLGRSVPALDRCAKAWSYQDHQTTPTR